LFENKLIFNEIVLTLFPEKKTLNSLLDYFDQKSNIEIYETLSHELKNLLQNTQSYKNKSDEP